MLHGMLLRQWLLPHILYKYPPAPVTVDSFDVPVTRNFIQNKNKSLESFPAQGYHNVTQTPPSPKRPNFSFAKPERIQEVVRGSFAVIKQVRHCS